MLVGPDRKCQKHTVMTFGVYSPASMQTTILCWKQEQWANEHHNWITVVWSKESCHKNTIFYRQCVALGSVVLGKHWSLTLTYLYMDSTDFDRFRTLLQQVKGLPQYNVPGASPLEKERLGMKTDRKSNLRSTNIFPLLNSRISSTSALKLGWRQSSAGYTRMGLNLFSELLQRHSRGSGLTWISLQ